MTTEEYYYSKPITLYNLDDSSIALRVYGQGPNLVFIHGFPTHGYTWRKIVPVLAERNTCFVLDLPGLGDSKWSSTTNFSSQGQAGYAIELLKKLKIPEYSIVAHNSGATVARIIALNECNKVQKLILFNTEIPNHRPPWIPFYQKIGLLPFVPFFIKQALQMKWFIKSSMGFRELYADESLLFLPENLDPYIKPLISSKVKMIGAFKYLKGIDWKTIDEFKITHENIKAETLFIWGSNDKTFPLKRGKEMLSQFKCKCDLVIIDNASLLPHEEKPKEVSEQILRFLEI